MKKCAFAFVFGVALIVFPVLPSLAQDKPFVVHDTKPVIMQGPYITSLSETEATIVWLTDTPCHSKVVYGAKGEDLTREAHNAKHGLLPIGRLHEVRLTGLEPGRAYTYKTVATRVVKMKAYWPEKGLPAESQSQTFTTFDRTKPAASFSAIADTHENLGVINALFKNMDWSSMDFLVHLGDAYSNVDREDQLVNAWLAPMDQVLGGSKLCMFIRGNHETRGAFARSFFDYFPTPEGRYYYTRDHGPLHIIVLDSGEDKDDKVNVYSQLNKFQPYLREEYDWLEKHLKDDRRAVEAPFRILLVHRPDLIRSKNESEWTALANRGKIDLVLGGHFHRTVLAESGTQENQNGFTWLALGQEQIAKVEATQQELRVVVVDKGNATVKTLTIKSRR